jgi:hypothetical protein
MSLNRECETSQPRNNTHCSFASDLAIDFSFNFALAGTQTDGRTNKSTNIPTHTYTHTYMHAGRQTDGRMDRQRHTHTDQLHAQKFDAVLALVSKLTEDNYL